MLPALDKGQNRKMFGFLGLHLLIHFDIERKAADL